MISRDFYKVIEQGKEKLIFMSFVKFLSKTRLKDLKIWFGVRSFLSFCFKKGEILIFMISPDTITIFMLTFSKYKPYKILISKDPTWSCLLDDTQRLPFPLTCLWDNTKQFAHVSPSRVISWASKRERAWYNNVREMKLLQLKGCLFLISLKSPSLVSSRSIYSRLFFRG